ncbi:serine carboxypeptidase-like [Cicer arietinum]|uniref:Carboxypeptidase n=1 Tax=Cicer arietinum TaxID=3827 RepID=A0A1S2YKC5_CICAR|nr:serine carboxypeptidase-like [Cicer arietinum]
MGFSKTSLSLLLLSFHILFSSSDATSRIPHRQLFQKTPTFSPNQQVNIIHGDSVDFVPGKMVEKNFSFLGGSDKPSIENLGHHAGYYSLPSSNSARMFYFFFESQNNTRDDPVVIWLTGGPGCSGEIALFYENGPFHISDKSQLVPNNYSWNKASNIIFVDQPIGTGFSYTLDDNDYSRDVTSISNYLYDFLQEFFKQHPDFVKNDFYITGESYAGQYIPALASRVRQGNKDSEGIHINLKGIAIGNGMTNPLIQYPSLPQYAVDMKLITKEDQDQINKLIPPCEDAIKSCESEGGDSCFTALTQCNDIMKNILSIAGGINYYDIRTQRDGELCYDFTPVETFLNDDSVKKALGVLEDLYFLACGRLANNKLIRARMNNFEDDIPALLEDGIKVLIYAGEYDLICNWLGISKWVHAMEWSGQKQFADSKTVPFLVDGAQAGSLNSYGLLSFLKVKGAGHMVPMDQPKAAFQMFVNWLDGTLNERSV